MDTAAGNTGAQTSGSLISVPVDSLPHVLYREMELVDDNRVLFLRSSIELSPVLPPLFYLLLFLSPPPHLAFPSSLIPSVPSSSTLFLLLHKHFNAQLTFPSKQDLCGFSRKVLNHVFRG